MKAIFRLFITISLISVLFSVNAQNNIDVLKYVNPFIGTGGDGHTFPNACVPHGNVQIGPQTEISGWDYTAGYRWGDTTLMGFSHTRLSGTGVSDLGDILFYATGWQFYNILRFRKKTFPKLAVSFLSQ